MAKMRKWKLEREYVQVPNETALAPEETISLQALGLIVNLWSYNTETWELHKTELYKRYVKNKEVSVKSAWNELMEAGYIIEYKFRVGKKWEYEYYYRITPFTEEEKAEILEFAKQEHGEIWGLDFQDLKMKTSKPRDNKYINNEKVNKQNTNITDNIDYIDDDKRTGSQKHSEEIINTVVEQLRVFTKDHIPTRSFNAVLRKVMDKYNQGKVDNFRDYFITALNNKIAELELRRDQEQAAENLKKMPRIETKYTGRVPFYNWLEQ